MPHPDRLPLFHVIGFVGQDPLPNPVGLDAVLRRTLAELPRESDVEWLALSAATGEADRRFADAAQNGGLGWEAVLPNHPNDLGVRLGAADRQAFETILPLAEHTRIVGEHPTPESGAFDCGLEIVNHCDLLLAVWDGRGDGAGTAAVVRYAREAGRPLIQIDPVTFAQTRERLERLKLGDRHVRQLNTMPAGPAEAADASDADPHQATVRAFQRDRKSTRLNSSHVKRSRMPSSA